MSESTAPLIGAACPISTLLRFGGILDDEIGGWFRLEAQEVIHQKQQYLPDSAILVTRTFAKQGLGQIEDFMPISHDEQKLHRIVRRVSCVRGEVHYKVHCRPAMDYARGSHRVLLKERGALFSLGNFPQAFTHLALISAAYNLDRTINQRQPGRTHEAA